MRVALVHDWLNGMRGGEKVLESLCEIYPDAEIYTLLHEPGTVSKTIEAHRINTSPLHKFPFGLRKYRYYLPLFPSLIERFDLREYDLIISSSHCVAKGVLPQPGALHISYVHSPMRYMWDLYNDYFGKDRVGWIIRQGAALFAPFLRSWDVYSCSRVDYFLCNSEYIKGRIQRIYGRDAEVIHPPVDISRFDKVKSSRKGDYYLIVSALVPYKRIDLAIEAFNGTDRPLKIAGTGPEAGKLKRMSGRNIEILGWVGDQDLLKLYEGARGFIFPGVEDFGITAVEAQAAGVPVIAYGVGGVLETVIDRETGVFFNRQTPESLRKAIARAEKTAWDDEKLRNSAKRFDKRVFKRRIGEFIAEKLEKQNENRN